MHRARIAMQAQETSSLRSEPRSKAPPFRAWLTAARGKASAQCIEEPRTHHDIHHRKGVKSETKANVASELPGLVAWSRPSMSILASICSVGTEEGGGVAKDPGAKGQEGGGGRV